MEQSVAVAGLVSSGRAGGFLCLPFFSTCRLFGLQSTKVVFLADG
jgi:hypothetical protein